MEMIAYKLLKGTWQNWIIVLKCINISWPLDNKLFYPKEPYSHFCEDKLPKALSLSLSLSLCFPAPAQTLTQCVKLQL